MHLLQEILLDRPQRLLRNPQLILQIRRYGAVPVLDGIEGGVQIARIGPQNGSYDFMRMICQRTFALGGSPGKDLLDIEHSFSE